jgi:hypothetical protein
MTTVTPTPPTFDQEMQQLQAVFEEAQKEGITLTGDKAKWQSVLDVAKTKTE